TGCECLDIAQRIKGRTKGRSVTVLLRLFSCGALDRIKDDPIRGDRGPGFPARKNEPVPRGEFVDAGIPPATPAFPVVGAALASGGKLLIDHRDLTATAGGLEEVTRRSGV